MQKANQGILQTIILLCFVLMNANLVFGQTYSDPYAIPRFQDFIGGCKLQAPNSGTAATQADLIAGYSSSNFYVADNDKVAFNQTGSSKRTELRHLTNWTLGSGDRSLHGRIKVVQQTCNQVTLMQIHDDANAGSGPNKPLLRIYKHQTKTPVNHLWAAIKTDAGGSNTTHIDLGLAPTGYFNCDIELVGGYMIIDVDGVEKVNMDVSYWTFPSYWKAGVYLQDNGEATAYFDELYLGTPGSGGNNAPTVSITAPTDGSTFNNGDNVTITANAADSDGSIGQVEFFVDGVSIGVDNSSPYSTSWTIGLGTYQLTAVATDDQSATTSSSVVSVSGIGASTDMYVAGISTGTQSAGKGKKHGKATVTIVDNNGTPVGNASVTGTFSGTFTETVTGTTGSNGTVDLLTTATAKGGVSVDLCVGNVSHASLTYNSSLNVITCTGSSSRLGFTTGSVESGEKGNPVIFPNPTKDLFFINFSLEEEAYFQVKLYGIDGKLLKVMTDRNLSAGANKIKLNLSGYESGVYFLAIQVNENTMMRRIVKD